MNAKKVLSDTNNFYDMIKRQANKGTNLSCSLCYLVFLCSFFSYQFILSIII